MITLKPIERDVLNCIQRHPEEWWTPKEVLQILNKVCAGFSNPTLKMVYNPLHNLFSMGVLERKMINKTRLSYKYKQPPISNDFVSDGCEQFGARP